MDSPLPVFVLLGVYFGGRSVPTEGVCAVSVDCAEEAGGTDGAPGEFAGVEGGVAGVWLCP
jgi:hypothetical protein